MGSEAGALHRLHADGVAQLALRVGIAVAKSDGNFDDDEKSAVREIARSLGFDPAEFGL